jgi:hypothetical protein
MPSESGSGGKSSGDIRAGGSFWETYLKDGITPSLKQTGEKLKTFDQQLKKIGSFSFAGSFLGGLAGGASLMGVLNSLGQAAADWVTSAEKFNKELERTQKLTTQIVALNEKEKERRDARIAALPEHAQGAAMQAEIDAAFTDMLGKENAHLAAIAEKKRLKAASGGRPWVLSAEYRAAANKAVTDAEEAWQKANTRWNDLQRKLLEFNRIGTGMHPGMSAALGMATFIGSEVMRERGGGGIHAGMGGMLGVGVGALGRTLPTNLNTSGGFNSMMALPFFFAEMAGKIGPALADSMSNVASRGAFAGSRLTGQFAFGDSVSTQKNILAEIRDHLAGKIGEEVAKQFRVQ